MAALYKPKFTGDAVALIVRGKRSHAHEPGVMEQHADCIMSDGAPIGFFGEGAGGSGSGGSTGIGMDGAVYDYGEFQTKRPFYVDGATAQARKVVSAVLRIATTTAVAKKFDDYWTKLDADPGTFHLLGGNCSTRASKGFIVAGLLNGGIPGLDTPDNLWRQICRVQKGKVTACYGYVDFKPKTGGGYEVQVTGL